MKPRRGIVPLLCFALVVVGVAVGVFRTFRTAYDSGAEPSASGSFVVIVVAVAAAFFSSLLPRPWGMTSGRRTPARDSSAAAGPPGAQRRGNRLWLVLWFVALIAAEWVVLQLFWGLWRAISPRVTWLLDYGCMLAMGIGFIWLTQRLFRDRSHGVRRVLLIGARVLVIACGTLLCFSNGMLVVVTSGEAFRELWSGVDVDRTELARLEGTDSDLVLYYDSGRAGVLVDAVTDVMVEHHGISWQHNLVRVNPKNTNATLERDATGVKLIFLDCVEGSVVSSMKLDWN
jgi:hypothetical protein